MEVPESQPGQQEENASAQHEKDFVYTRAIDGGRPGMGIGSFFLLLALFCMSTISGAVVTVFLHEFGHLLARKICRWPTEYIRIPRRPKAWRTVARIWGVELQLGTSLKDWLMGGGLTGPWSPENKPAEQLPRTEACLVLVSGPLANLVQGILCFAALRTTTTSISATVLLIILAFWGFSVGAANLAPIGTDSDGTQLWTCIFGRTTIIAKPLGWLAATIVTLLAIVVAWAVLKQ
jgi:membrane-associated protease RseP (regulator of RpoE activity)